MRSQICVAPTPADLAAGKGAPAGMVSYVDDLRPYLAVAPTESLAFGAGSATIPLPSQCHWACGAGKTWRVARQSAWGTVDIPQAEAPVRILLASLRRCPPDSVRWPASVGSAARQILSAWRDTRPDLWPALKPDMVQAMRRCVRGGIQRTLGTYCREASYLDISAAYRWVHEQGIPSGHPIPCTRVDHRIQTSDQCLARLRQMHGRGFGGLVGIPLASDGHVMYDPSPRREDGIFAPQKYPRGGFYWLGPSVELQAILEAGLAEVIPSVWESQQELSGMHGAWFAMSRAAGELMTRLEGELPRDAYRGIYKALWPHWDATGGWRGHVLPRPPWEYEGTAMGEDGEGFPIHADSERPTDGLDWRPDPATPDLWWYREDAPISGGGELYRPDVVAWITGSIRAEIYRRMKYEPLMIQVDSLIVPDSTRHLWGSDVVAQADARPGQWRVQASGVYLGASPGQYLIGGTATPDAQTWRLKLCGIADGGLGLASLVRSVRKLELQHKARGGSVARVVLELSGWNGAREGQELSWPVFSPKGEQ